MFKRFLLYFSIYVGIAFFAFRSLILNISSNLFDWLDYPLVIWIINQNIEKITKLQFGNYFSTTAFYPHPYSLLFADTFLPQSIIALPFSLISKNPILVFNIVFIITILLNYIASYVFWRHIFKKDIIAFLGGLFVAFSPFFHLESSHFQMLSYWPFFFSLYFIFKAQEKNSARNSVIAGLFLAIQFLAGVYIAVFLMFLILAFYAVSAIWKKQFIKLAKEVAIIFSIFVLADGVFIKGYSDSKNFYQISRNLLELIHYSANLSDYIFTERINSLIHHLPIIQKWNSANKNTFGGHGSFPGFLLFFLSIFGFFEFIVNRKRININIPLDKMRAFFIIMTLAGFVFSLGPRLSFNGNYAHMILPYSLVIKFFPFFDSVRSLARWNFIFYIGIIFFALFTINRITSSNVNSLVKKLPVILVLFFLLEYFPFNLQTHAEPYLNSDYETLKSLCYPQKQVLLEFPVMHFDVEGGTFEGVNYISKVLLSSIYHQCYLVNGYSGYDLPAIGDMKNEMYVAIAGNQLDQFYALLKSSQASIFKYNRDKVVRPYLKNLDNMIAELVKENKLQQISPSLYLVRSTN